VGESRGGDQAHLRVRGLEEGVTFHTAHSGTPQCPHNSESGPIFPYTHAILLSDTRGSHRLGDLMASVGDCNAETSPPSFEYE
jgi:hypothetical protein